MDELDKNKNEKEQKKIFKFKLIKYTKISAN